MVAVFLRASNAIVNRRYPHAGALGELAWRWRVSVSFYDALYVSLAASLDLPLVTADARLSRMPRAPCVIELV